MFNSSLWHKTHLLCCLLVAASVSLISCGHNAKEPEVPETEKQTLAIGNASEKDVFVLTSLNQIIPNFDYNLYSDSACTDKVLYDSASYFMYVGNDKFLLFQCL